MPQYNPTSAFPNPFGGGQAQTPYPTQVAPVEQPAMVNALDMPQDPRAHSAWYKRLLDMAAAQQALGGGGGAGAAGPPTGGGGGLVGQGIGIAKLFMGGA